MLLNTLQCAGQILHNKELWGPNVNSAKVETFWVRFLAFPENVSHHPSTHVCLPVSVRIDQAVMH